MSASARSSPLGSMLDVGWGDLIDYLGNDPQTQSIVIYMESIGDARCLPLGGPGGGADQTDHRDQSRADAKPRPRRPPRTPAPSPAATKCWRPPSAAAACCGSTRIADCSTWPKCWQNSRGRTGPRLAIVTNAGGPGVLATDALISDGGQLAALSPETIGDLEQNSAAALEPQQSRSTSWATPAPERYAKAVEIGRRGPEQRWPAGDPDAAGHDRSARRRPSG